MHVNYSKIKEFKDYIGHYLEAMNFFNILIPIQLKSSLFVSLDSLDQHLMHLLLKFNSILIIKIQIIGTVSPHQKDVQHSCLS